MAKRINSKDNDFKYLHVAQLLKHILGLQYQLKSRIADGNRTARLLYLFYDVTGEEGSKHLEEVKRFQDVVKSQFHNRQAIIFQFKTYQEVMMNLALKHRDQHPAYFDWMLERYL